MFVKISHTAIYSGINIIHKVDKTTEPWLSNRMVNLINSLNFGVHHLSFGVNETDGETLMYQLDGGIPKNYDDVKWKDMVAFELISPTGVERIMLGHSVGHADSHNISDMLEKLRGQYKGHPEFLGLLEKI